VTQTYIRSVLGIPARYLLDVTKTQWGEGFVARTAAARKGLHALHVLLLELLRQPPVHVQNVTQNHCGKQTHVRIGKQVARASFDVGVGVSSTVLQAPRAKITAARAIQGHAASVVQGGAAT
jgi:hypothetical protein